MSDPQPIKPKKQVRHSPCMVQLKRIVRLMGWALPFFFFSGLFGQSYLADIQKLSVEDGLSSRFVTSLCQDSQGFMWIGTWHGLSRYDGYAFRLYTTENSALSTNDIKELFAGEDQKLWVIHLNPENPEKPGEIDFLDLKSGEIQRFDEAFKGVAPFRAKDVWDIYSNLTGTLISTREGTLYRYANHRFKPIFTTPGKKILIYHTDGKYVSIKVVRKEWLILDMEGRTIQKMPLKYGWGIRKTFWSFADQGKKMLQFDQDKKIIREYDRNSLGLPIIPKIIGQFLVSQAYILDAESDLWWEYHLFDKISRFFVYHPQYGRIIDLYPRIAPLLSYNFLKVNDILIDPEHRAWVATSDGIFIIRLRKNKFTTVLKNFSTRGMTEDIKGNIYINSYGGRFRLHSGGAIEEVDNLNKVWLGAFTDKEGSLWFSSQYNMIERYSPFNNQTYCYRDTVDAPVSEWALIRDKTGQVWVGTGRGLSVLDPETGHYRKFTRYNRFDQLEESSIYHLSEEKEGIWIASSSGLYLLEPGKGITARYATDEPFPHTIPYDHLLHFYREGTGAFWLATEGGGLVRFEPENGKSERFTTADGLSHDIIYAVYEDSLNRLWLPGNYGLMRFDKQTRQVKTYLTTDGIAHAEFNTSSHYQSSDGRLYFGGIFGVTVFDPEDFTEESVKTVPLRLTGCQVLDGQDGELKDRTREVIGSGGLTLAPSEKSFIVEFALLNYENPLQNTYSYQLEGLDREWTHIRGNSLRINALPYGRYTLRIKGKGIDGTVSAHELKLAVTVSTPFYLEPAFIAGCAMLTGLLIYLLFQWRLRNLKQAKLKLQEGIKQRTVEIQQQKDQIEVQSETLREMNETQSRWFTNIAHELRTPLILVLGPIRQFLKIYGKRSDIPSESIQLAERNSTQLLHLVNEILDVSKLEAGRLELKKEDIELTRLVRETLAQFDSAAAQKGVALKLSIRDHIALPLDKDRARKILVNLVSNALKFTHRGGAIAVAVQYEAGKAHLSVADTGEGIPEKDLPRIFDRYYQASTPGQVQQGGAGIGLALSRELALLHGGELTVTSQLGKGSTFTLTLPDARNTDGPEPFSGMLTHGQERPALPVASAPRSAGDALPGEQQKKPVILLVEDNPDMRQYILSLMPDSWHVAEAGDGVEALDYLQTHRADLVISDVMMPRMDGFQLLEKLKEQPATQGLSIIMLTARAAQKDRMRALTIGVDDYLTKPFEEEELVARVRYLLRNRSKKQQWTVQLQEGENAGLSADGQFLAHAEETVLRSLDDPDYGIPQMASELLVSQRQLFRNIKALTGLSPLQFIRELRLQKAYRLLENREKETVAEVMQVVGFQRSDYFARIYRKRFGKLPSEHQASV